MPILCREMAQDVLENAAVLEVVELVEGIDPADQRNPLQPAVGGDDLAHQPLPRLQVAVQSADRDLLAALEAEALPGRSLLEAERDHAHAYQVRAVDALEGLGDHGPDTEQRRALR